MLDTGVCAGFSTDVDAETSVEELFSLFSVSFIFFLIFDH